MRYILPAILANAVGLLFAYMIWSAGSDYRWWVVFGIVLFVNTGLVLYRVLAQKYEKITGIHPDDEKEWIWPAGGYRRIPYQLLATVFYALALAIVGIVAWILLLYDLFF